MPMSNACAFLCYPLKRAELEDIVPEACAAFYDALDRVVIRAVEAAGGDDAREDEILRSLALGGDGDPDAAEILPFLSDLTSRFADVTGVPLEFLYPEGESLSLDLPEIVWSVRPTMLTPAAERLQTRLGRKLLPADYVEFE